MSGFRSRFLKAMFLAMWAAVNVLGTVSAASTAPAQTAESIRTSLINAQLSLAADPDRSALLVNEAKATYQTELSNAIAGSDDEVHSRILAGFETLSQTVSGGDGASFAAARA